MDKVRDLSARWIYLVDEILKHDEINEDVKNLLRDLNSVSRQLALHFNPENEHIDTIKINLSDKYKNISSSNPKIINEKLYDFITFINDIIYYCYYSNDNEAIEEVKNFKMRILTIYNSKIREYLKNEWERVKQFH